LPWHVNCQGILSGTLDLTIQLEQAYLESGENWTGKSNRPNQSAMRTSNGVDVGR